MNRHVLITGATRGIGRACLTYFAGRRWAVTAVARTANDLEKLAAAFPATEITTVVADLGTADGVAAVPTLTYDLILLNAAAFVPGRLLTGDSDVFEDQWRMNVLGNHRLARRLLPRLVSKGRGHLVVIGSLGTDYWPAHLTAYVATKYALRGLFAGWQKELADTGVLTTLVAPGATLTSSWDGEVPPPNILLPGRVAEIVGQVVERETEGRVVIEP